MLSYSFQEPFRVCVCGGGGGGGGVGGGGVGRDREKEKERESAFSCFVLFSLSLFFSFLFFLSLFFFLCNRLPLFSFIHFCDTVFPSKGSNLLCSYARLKSCFPYSTMAICSLSCVTWR